MKYFQKFNNMSLAIALRFSDVDCVIVDHSASASTWLPCPLWPKTLVEELHLCFSSTKPQLAAQLVTICLTLFLGWRLKLFLGLFTASLLFHTFPSFNCRRAFYFVLFLAPGYGPFPPATQDLMLVWRFGPETSLKGTSARLALLHGHAAFSGHASLQSKLTELLDVLNKRGYWFHVFLSHSVKL